MNVFLSNDIKYSKLRQLVPNLAQVIIKQEVTTQIQRWWMLVENLGHRTGQASHPRSILASPPPRHVRPKSWST